MPIVAVGSLGGTITMTASPGQAGVVPGLRAEDLMRAVPGLDEVAQVRAVTLQTVPGASLSFADLFAALQWARDEVDAGAAGAVLVQGTDTLEESAYLLDLFWDRPQPLVLTGAMRSPQQAGADGPANVLASVATAAAAEATDVGTVVVLNDEVHAAARVRKTDSTAVQAFASPGTGSLGRLVEGGLVLTGRAVRHEPLPLPDTDALARVAMLESHLGDDGGLLRLVLDAAYDGVVLGAFGVGHVSTIAAEVVSEAVRQMPVVVASRTGTGSTLTTTYGFPGSESDLLRRGAVMAGWLDPRKARLLLTVLLTLGYPARDIAAEFTRRGRP
jgi:L-asparaginase